MDKKCKIVSSRVKRNITELVKFYGFELNSVYFRLTSEYSGWISRGINSVDLSKLNGLYVQNNSGYLVGALTTKRVFKTEEDYIRLDIY